MMNIKLSPFMYYMIHSVKIEQFITLESHGARVYHIHRANLEALIKSYIKINSHGVDPLTRDSYVSYICDQLSPA